MMMIQHDFFSIFAGIDLEQERIPSPESFRRARLDPIPAHRLHLRRRPDLPRRLDAGPGGPDAAHGSVTVQQKH